MAGIDIGVVMSVVGIRSFWLRFAGTTPMSRRADTLWSAAEFVCWARALVA